MRVALGESSEEEQVLIFREYENRYLRTATALLDPQTGLAFETELREQWPDWVRSLER